MKVLMVNGSPHPTGATYRALRLVEGPLSSCGVETSWVQLGNAPVRGCLACNHCAKTHRCVFVDDICNELIEGLLSSDAVVIGSPVYFAGPNSALCAVLDRAFYATSRFGGLLRGKPAAAVVSLRRSGATEALRSLERYFTYAEMPVISTQGWAAQLRDDSTVEEDPAGARRLVRLGENMAHALGVASSPEGDVRDADRGVGDARDER